MSQTSRQRLPAEERRKQILLSATRVFARSGYRGATTRQIAAEASVAEALLYRYFPNKRELFIAAVDRTSRYIVDQIENILQEHIDSPHDALEQLLRFTTRAVTKSESLAKMLFIVTAELDDPDIRDAFEPHQERALEALDAALLTWQRAGILKATLPVRATSWTVIGAFRLAALMQHMGKFGDVDTKQVLQLATHFLND